MTPSSGLLLALGAAGFAAACVPDPRVLHPYDSRLSSSRAYSGSANGRGDRHRGVDFGPFSVGDEVLASARGTVVSVRRSKVSGRAIEVSHAGTELRTFYVHLDEVFVSPGEVVARGQPIGTVGLFPFSRGAVHVHLEVWCWSGERCAESWPLENTTDPMRFMEGCFESAKEYPKDRFVLTYPFWC